MPKVTVKISPPPPRTTPQNNTDNNLLTHPPVHPDRDYRYTHALPPTSSRDAWHRCGQVLGGRDSGRDEGGGSSGSPCSATHHVLMPYFPVIPVENQTVASLVGYVDQMPSLSPGFVAPRLQPPSCGSAPGKAASKLGVRTSPPRPSARARPRRSNTET